MELLLKHGTSILTNKGFITGVPTRNFPALAADLTAHMEGEMMNFYEWVNSKFWKMDDKYIPDLHNGDLPIPRYTLTDLLSQFQQTRKQA